LGITSVQLGKEEIVPMKEMKMEWKRIDFQNKKNCTILYCNLRRTKLGSMLEKDIVRYNYCLPHLINLKVEETDNNTEVMGNVKIGTKMISFTYDWEMDDFDEFMTELITENELTKDEEKKEMEDYLKNEIKAAKNKIKEEKQKKKDFLDTISDDEKKKISELKLYKFYPQNSDIDIENFKSAYINRYYGRANKIF
jgi:hypothetical protein